MIGKQTFMIQSKTLIDDGIGGTTPTWSDVMAVYGYIDMLTGSNDTMTQNAFVEQSTHVLIVPLFTDGITDKMRVVDVIGRWYSITFVDDPVGQRHHNEIYLKFGGVIDGE
jgi:SPP1 family predicted phage head-tail adaptor